MRSMFSIEEVGEMLNMKPADVEKEIEGGHMSFTYQDGEKMITLYDLEKYMGAEQTKKITSEFLEENS